MAEDIHMNGSGRSPIVDYTALLKLLQCPVCSQYLRPPIPQCKKGHVICDACRPKVKGVCPICKQTVTNQTNLMVEKISVLVNFPCTHAGKGCCELVPLRAKSHHEAVCDYRPVHCPNEQAGCTAVLCVKEIQTHLRQCGFRPR